MGKLLMNIYDRYCLWRYGKTYTQMVLEKEKKELYEYIARLVDELNRPNGDPMDYGDR